MNQFGARSCFRMANTLRWQRFIAHQVTSIQPFLSLSEQLQRVTTDYFLIAGDFNMPDVRWVNKVPVFSSKASLNTAFGDLIASHGLFQFVDIPTRYSSVNSNTLDLLFSNSPSLIQSVSAIPGISDHVGITAKVLCDRPSVLPTGLVRFTSTMGVL